jgi:hypothetical protein
MLTVPADKITPDKIAALLEDQTPESRTLDYKRDLSLDAPDARKELARDVSSFANAAGGFLVYGVDEERGVPTKLLGVKCDDFDALKLRIESILRDSVQPRVPGFSIGQVVGAADDPIIVIHVPQSWVGPHMAASPGQSYFYSRTNSGKQPLDVQQIRHAFIAGTEIGERIRRFRDERLGRILANEGGMPLWKTGPTLVNHLCPLVDNADVFPAIAGRTDKLPPHCENSTGTSARFTLDGYVTFPSVKLDQNVVYCYTQVFRSGAFERCEPIGIRSDFTPHQGYGSDLEKAILDAARLFVSASRQNGSEGPLTFMSTLLEVRGIRIARSDHDNWNRQRVDSIDRAVVTLPEVIVEGATVTAEDLKPTFDALWQSSGWPHSPDFGADGKWSPPGR